VDVAGDVGSVARWIGGWGVGGHGFGLG
jgi:hypothetical protein